MLIILLCRLADIGGIQENDTLSDLEVDELGEDSIITLDSESMRLFSPLELGIKAPSDGDNFNLSISKLRLLISKLGNRGVDFLERIKFSIGDKKNISFHTQYFKDKQGVLFSLGEYLNRN